MFAIQPLHETHLDKPDGVLIKTGVKNDAFDRELESYTLTAFELWFMVKQLSRDEPLPMLNSTHSQMLPYLTVEASLSVA